MQRAWYGARVHDRIAVSLVVSSTPGASNGALVGGSAAPTQAGSDPGTDGPSRSMAGDIVPSSGTSIGRYVVLSRLGSGGMGVVYVAYDPELDRKVALKVLRRPIDGSTAKRARQLREAQALARLTHPNVVTVYDAGSWQDHTFLAMELVEGQTLSQWSRGVTRTWREVLAVMIEAGRGLVAAHAANIVHRDFKPDNVMVADDGRVLVMDFGLARALEVSDSGELSVDGLVRPLPGLDVATQWAARGTPGYMAPEQHAGGDGDERIDQFGFCVTLWQMAYGERPHPGESVAETVRAVSDGTLRDPPAQRRVPAWLRRAIVRGLQPRPAERWPSMQALLDALQRGQTASRRRWIGFAAAAAALGLLTAGAFYKRAHDEAVQHCITTAETIAQAWPGTDDAAREELTAAFAATGLGYGPDAATRTAKWLDDWTDDWRQLRQQVCDAERIDGPSTQTEASRVCLEEGRVALATLVETLRGADADVVRRSIGAAAGLPHVAPCGDPKALAQMPSLPQGQDAERVAEIKADLGRGRSLRATGKYAESRDLAVAALARARDLGWPPLVATALRDAGHAAGALKDADAAEPWLEEAYLVALATGADATAVDAATELVSVVGIDAGRPADGRRWGKIAAALLERMDDVEGLDAARLDLKIARIDRAAGDYDAAIERLERALQRRLVVQGGSHPDLAGPRVNLANVYIDRGDYDRAARLFEQAIAAFEATLGPDHPDTALVVNNLGVVAIRRGDIDEAERLLRKALEIRERGLSADHPDVAETLTNLGVVANMRDDNETASELYHRALKLYEAAYGPDHPMVAHALTNVGVAEASLGNFDAAETAYVRARAIVERVHGPDHPDIAHLWVGSAEIEAGRGNMERARELATRGRVVQEKALGKDHPALARTLRFIGTLDLERGDLEAGEKSCRRAEEIFLGTEGRDGIGTKDAQACLAHAKELREQREASP